MEYNCENIESTRLVVDASKSVGPTHGLPLIKTTPMKAENNIVKASRRDHVASNGRIARELLHSLSIKDFISLNQTGLLRKEASSAHLQSFRIDDRF